MNLLVANLKNTNTEGFLAKAKLSRCESIVSVVETEDELEMPDEEYMARKSQEENMDAEFLFQSMHEPNNFKKFTIDPKEEGNFAAEFFKEFDSVIPLDIDALRTTIPSTADLKISPLVIWRLMKDLIGKDLSKFAMPVWFSEPTTNLMKGGEMAYHTSNCLENVLKEKDPERRMARMVTVIGACFIQLIGRGKKPFNPMLGETYELVTPKFRYMSE